MLFKTTPRPVLDPHLEADADCRFPCPAARQLGSGPKDLPRLLPLKRSSYVVRYDCAPLLACRATCTSGVRTFPGLRPLLVFDPGLQTFAFTSEADAQDSLPLRKMLPRSTRIIVILRLSAKPVPSCVILTDFGGNPYVPRPYIWPDPAADVCFR